MIKMTTTGMDKIQNNISDFIENLIKMEGQQILLGNEKVLSRPILFPDNQTAIDNQDNELVINWLENKSREVGKILEKK
jgi:hypothetical protein